MKSKLTKKNNVETGDSSVRVKVQKAQARFKMLRNPDGTEIGQGDFLLRLDITTAKDAVYIPLSVASGKKTVGFIYHIEGTGAGTMDTTDVSCNGEGVTKITLGTLLYAKIPAGGTASFRLFIQIRGGKSKEYRIIINQISYKLDPSDARYKRLETDISTESVKFL